MSPRLRNSPDRNPWQRPSAPKEGVDFLADERKKAQFGVDALKIVWSGGKDEFEVSDRMARLVASDPGMFVPAIKGQGTDEQQKKWLPMAYKMQIIGCYAQIELGHGSNVQGLETTATFDPETDEFVINSPTLTSSKCAVKCFKAVTLWNHGVCEAGDCI